MGTGKGLKRKAALRSRPPVSEVPVAADDTTESPVKKRLLSVGGEEVSDAIIEELLAGRKPKKVPKVKVKPMSEQEAQNTKHREAIRSAFRSKKYNAQLAEQLELGIWRAACPNGELVVEGTDVYKDYRDQFKRICSHLRENPALLTKIENGELLACELALKSNDELITDRRRQQLQQHIEDGKKEALGRDVTQMGHWCPTELFDCPECSKTDCIYIEIWKGYHHYDDNHLESVYTLRCLACKKLWKEDQMDGGRMAVGSETGRGLELQAPCKERPQIWKEHLPKPDWLLKMSSG